jgi:hypothetical protein
MAAYDGVKRGGIYLMYSGLNPASVTVSDGTIYTPVSQAVFPLTSSATGTTNIAIWAVLPKHWQDPGFAGFALMLIPNNGFAVGNSSAPMPSSSGFFYAVDIGRLFFFNPGKSNNPGYNSFFPPAPGWCDCGTLLPIPWLVGA